MTDFRSALDRIDPVCEAFEDALMAGQSPRIADFVEQSQPGDRVALFEHLLELDVEYRHRLAAPVRKEDYLQEYPQYGSSISRICDDQSLNDEAISEQHGSKDAIHADRLATDRPRCDRERLDLVGQQLDQYRIVAKIGEGGMGTVYKATHIKLDKVVALKILPAESLASAERIARFEREMLSVGRLNCPHIVGAIDARETDGAHFLVMEYLEGSDLSALVEHSGPLPIADACEIIRQAAVGLEYAHHHEMIHRDIKPSNLMLTSEGQVKILDLGLALIQTDESSESQLTSTGQIMGTPDYMAPEQIDASGPVDARADLYGLGCTIYKLLTGETPFAHLNLMSTYQRMKAHVEEPARPVSEHRGAIPGELVAIVECLLAKDPADRYDNPRQLADALQPFTAEADLRALYQQINGQEGESTLNPGRGRTVALASSAMVDTSVPHHDLRSVQAGQPSKLVSTQAARSRSTPRNRVALAALGIVILAAVVIRLVTNTGDVTIKSYDPNMEIIVKRNDRVVDEFEVRTRNDSTSYFAGEYEIVIKGGQPTGSTIKNRTFKLTRDKSVLVEIIPSKIVARTTPKQEPPSKVSSEKTKPSGAKERHVIGESPKLATWKPGSAESRLPGGLIPRPADLPGVKRWQVFTRQPRGGIQELAWSPDGKWLAATVSLEGTVRIYEAATGRLAHILPQGGVATLIYRGGLAWSPDSKTLAVVKFPSGQPRLWNVDGTAGPSFDQVRTVRRIQWHPQGDWLAAVNPYDSTYLLSRDGSVQKRLPTKSVTGEQVVGWSPDGNWLATSNLSANKTQLWQPDGTPGPEVTGFFAAWRPDSRQFAAAERQTNRVHFYSVEGKREKSLEGYFHLSWCPDGKGLILIKYLSKSNSTEVDYQPSNGAPLKRLGPTHYNARVDWSHDRSTALIFAAERIDTALNKAVMLRVAGDDLVVIDLKQNLPGLNAIALSPNGRQAAYGLALYDDDLYGAWQSATGVMGTFQPGQTSKKDFTRELPKAVDVAWHPADERFASASRDGTIRVWHADGAQPRSLHGHKNWVNSVAWQPDGKALASISSTGQLRSWDEAGESRLLRPAQPRQGYVRPATVAFNPANGRQLVQAGASGVSIGQWDGEAYEPQRISDIPAHVNLFRWSPDGRQFVAVRQSFALGDRDVSPLYFGRADGTEIRKVDIPSMVAAVAWSPDSSRVVVFSWGIKAAPMFVTPDGQVGKPLPNQDIGWVTDAVWQPGGRVFAASGSFGLPLSGVFGVVLWNEDGSVGPSLEDAYNISGVKSLSFSHDDRHLIAGGDSGIAMWDMKTLKLTRLFVPLPEDQAAAFSPAGELLFSTPGATDELVYVVEREEGRFELFTPAEFRTQFLSSGAPQRPKSTIPASPPDPDRDAAERVLKAGGNVSVQLRESTTTLQVYQLEDLPPQRFDVQTVLLNSHVLKSKPVDDDVLRSLSSLSRLNLIDLFDSGLDDDSLALLTDLPKLSVLMLDQTAVTDGGLAHLAQFESLEVLALMDTLVSDDGLRHLNKLVHLRDLRLNYTDVSDRGLLALTQNKELQELFLCGTQVTNAGVHHFKEFPKLRRLAIQGTPITDMGLAEIQQCKSLEALDLSGPFITGDGLEELRNIPNLKSLTLSDFNVSDALFSKLARIESLEWLSFLDRSSVSDEGLYHLQELPNLTTLRLGGPFLSDRGLKELVKLKRLQVLQINESRISNEGLADLHPLSGLRELRITSGEITDEGCEALTKLPRLKTLFLYTPRVTNAGVNKIAEGLPNCMIFVDGKLMASPSRK